MSNLIISGHQFNNINKITFDTPNGSIATFIIEDPSNAPDPADILYFKPTENFLNQYPDTVRFAMWTADYDSNERWFSFERVGDSEYFKINNIRNFLINDCEIFIIVNLKGSSTEDKWENTTNFQSDYIYPNQNNYRNQLINNNLIIQSYSSTGWRPTFSNYTE